MNSRICSGRLRAVKPPPTAWFQAFPRHSGVPASLAELWAALSRRQYRKALAAPQREFVGRAVALVDAVNTRAGRPAAISLDHLRDRRRRPRQHRLDGAIAPVAHPAGESMTERGVLGEGAVAHALHAPADDEVSDHARAHPTSPVSLARTPRHRDGAQRASERM